MLLRGETGGTEVEMEKKKRASQTQLTKDNVEDFEKQDETGK